MERIAGVLVLLLVALVAVSVSMGAGGVGLDARSEYFRGDGPQSWSVVATQHRDQLADGLTPLAAASAVAMFLGGVLYLTHRRLASGLASAASFGFVTTGALMAIGVAMRFWVADLAGRWANTDSAVGHLADSAFTAHTVWTVAMFVALPLLMASLIALGIVVQRAAALPRWLMAFPVVGGALLVISPIGFAVGPGFASLVVASGATLLVWLVVVSGRLTLRGVR